MWQDLSIIVVLLIFLVKMLFLIMMMVGFLTSFYLQLRTSKNAKTDLQLQLQDMMEIFIRKEM